MWNNQKGKRWNNKKEAFRYAKSILLRHNTVKQRKEAAEALQYCAEQEDAIAQYQLYALKYNDPSTQKDSETFSLCEKAARSGYAAAQYDLALHYFYGDIVEKDMYQAIIWMEKAASQQYREAAQKLYFIFQSGTKVRRNPERAQYWKSFYEGISTEKLNPILEITPEDLIIPKEQPKQPEISMREVEVRFVATSQKQVIEAPEMQSFVINAGPGTGKTYTLIQRINYLVSVCDVDPEEIVILSFTNAVVKEVKERLIQCSNTIEGVRALRTVDVKTFHSFAYWLLKMANEECDEEDWAKVDLDFRNITYDDCMVLGARLLRKMSDIVSGWKYVIVDEIQDINNGKADFVLAILEACTQYNVPFMLLGDSCQAIYDYLDKDNSVGMNIKSSEFYQRIKELAKERAQFCSFSLNHRQISQLQFLTAPFRESILNNNLEEFNAQRKDFRNGCPEISADNIRELKEFISQHHGKTICFMERSNFNTKLLSHYLLKNNVEHTCVLNKQKDSYPRWIGEVFGGFDKEYLSEETLRQRCNEIGYDTDKIEKIWQGIKKNIGYFSEIIPMKAIVSLLRSHQIDSLLQDYSDEKETGIYVSNVHRAKGLEYEYVIMDSMMVNSRYKEMEETRVFYVAITRPKTNVYLIGNTPAIKGKINSLRDGYRYYRKERISEKQYRHKYVEIVNDDEKYDVGPRNILLDRTTQQYLHYIHKNDPVELILDSTKGKYQIVVKDMVVGYMSHIFTGDLLKINRDDLPPKFEEIYVEDVYTYIGEEETRHSMQMNDNGTTYGNYNIWNFITFSGPARAVYGSTKDV